MDVFSELNTGISVLKDNVYLFMCVFSTLLHQLGLIARRDKKAFLSDQCKEIEENNRMGKTRDLFTPSPRAWRPDFPGAARETP